MSTANVNDPHGVRGLPRSGLLVQRAIVAGLATLSGVGDDAVIAKRFPKADARRKDQLRIFRPMNANEVSAVDYPASLGDGDAQLIAAMTVGTALGRLPLAWDLPLNSQVNGLATEVPAAAIRAPGQAIPLSAGSYVRDHLARISAKALLVVSQQLLEQPTAENALGIRLVRAAARAIDAEAIRLALDGAGPLAGSAAAPDSLLARIREAVEALVDAGADPAGIAWVAHPNTCMAIGSYPAGWSPFPGVGINGGSLIGMPLFATLGATEGTLTAIASDCVARTLLVPEIDASKSGTLEFSSAPTGAALPDTLPVAASQQRVSLYQNAMVALRIDAPFSIAFGRALRAVQIDGVLPSVVTA